MTAIHIIILLGTGIAVGFASGLLGIGGGIIMGPVQYLIYTSMGLPTDLAIRMSFGTNLLVIFFVALSGTWRHHRKRAVQWKAAIIMGSCSLIGSIIGATLTTHLPGEPIKIAFGAVILLSAIRMLTMHLPEVNEKPKDNIWLWVAWALPIGIMTGLLGIGGGVVVVPVMILALRFSMHEAVATSLGMMMLASAGGVIGYIVNGLGVTGLPAYTVGYVNLQSWLLLSITSIGMAQAGAITAHRLPATQLKYGFVAIMLYMGLKMTGLFDWLGWPL
ncbi:sulfite exporter TauE/SafE family protein [Chloroflexota bacterium]